MPVFEAQFENEKELENWVRANISDFFPGAIFIPGCSITTVAGKSGVPDGFVFNLEEQAWYVIEAELLVHGVWNHIAEQIIRFIVATQNPRTRRIIRDKLFEYLDHANMLQEAARKLETTPERLLQQIELYIEGVDPEFAIFIEETNQDLLDMVRALSAPTKVYEVRKLLVDNQPHYYSPNRNIPVIATEPGEEGGLKAGELEIIDLLGGGHLEASIHGFKCYHLNDGSIIYVKRSKYYPQHDYYWYGMPPSALERCKHYKVSHIVFIMGEDGFVKVPLDTVLEFLENTRATMYDDGTVRHYHCLISPGPEPVLFWSQATPQFDLKEHFQAL